MNDTVLGIIWHSKTVWIMKSDILAIVLWAFVVHLALVLYRMLRGNRLRIHQTSVPEVSVVLPLTTYIVCLFLYLFS